MNERATYSFWRTEHGFLKFVIPNNGHAASALLVLRNEDEDSLLRAKPLLVFAGDDEGFHHLCVHEVAVELVEFPQPEVVTSKVCGRRVVGIPPQVTEILHQHNALTHSIYESEVLDGWCLAKPYHKKSREKK